MKSPTISQEQTGVEITEKSQSVLNINSKDQTNEDYKSSNL